MAAVQSGGRFFRLEQVQSERGLVCLGAVPLDGIRRTFVIGSRVFRVELLVPRLH